ncbi:hypothetical protein LZ30DRAFT_735226 [Colletotrichum cereale]|nr:hypothetical protein LZ30DRAFT_735226 [Colletotrichum cereale]
MALSSWGRHPRCYPVICKRSDGRCTDGARSRRVAPPAADVEQRVMCRRRSATSPPSRRILETRRSYSQVLWRPVSFVTGLPPYLVFLATCFEVGGLVSGLERQNPKAATASKTIRILPLRHKSSCNLLSREVEKRQAPKIRRQGSMCSRWSCPERAIRSRSGGSHSAPTRSFAAKPPTCSAHGHSW